MSVYYFDQCVVDTEKRLLRVAGHPVEVQPLVFDLICHFAARPARVVSREELLQAVWRSSAVSESVVARAVMKARRALGDDARDARLLLTVPRAGYRLVAEVSQDSQTTPLSSPASSVQPLAYALAVLPFRLPAALAGEAWQGLGLMALAHHLLCERMDWVLAPPTDVMALYAGPQQAGEPSDELARACRLLGAREALLCRVEPEGAGWCLRLLRGARRELAVETVLRGGDPVRLTRQTVAGLCAQPWPGDGRDLRDAPAHEALARALALELAGQAAAAWQALQPRLADATPSARLRLDIARLARANGQPETADAQLAAALAGADGAPGTLARVVILLTQAELAQAQVASELAARLCEQALAAAQGLPAARALLPALLAIQAQALRVTGERAGAMQLAERAVTAAITTGSAVIEVTARAQLATLLIMCGDGARATEVAERAIAQARACGLPVMELRASLLLMMLPVDRREFEQALQRARGTHALALACGDAAQAGLAELLILHCLTASGQFEAARATALARQDLDEVPVRARVSVACLQASLAWQGGDAEAALALLERAQASGTGRALNLEVVDESQCLYWVALGRLAEARQALARKDAARSPAGVALCQAALARAESGPAAAIAVLAAWLQGRPGRALAEMDNRLNLAWLLLEAEAPGRPDPELDALAAGLIDYAPEWLPARLVTAAYLLRRAPSDQSRARWDAVLAGAPGLGRRCPELLAPGYRDALAAARALALPNVLSVICL